LKAAHPLTQNARSAIHSADDLERFIQVFGRVMIAADFNPDAAIRLIGVEGQIFRVWHNFQIAMSTLHR
jgi:hypothetical protein